MNRTKSDGYRVGHSTRAEDLLATLSEQEAVQLSQEPREEPLHRVTTASSLTSRSCVVRLWHRHVALKVKSDACRDHWANERTALGYIRTSQAFAITGVVVAQVMRLNGDDEPGPHVGFFDVSIPLAIVFYVTAIIVSIVGAIRFYHLQHEMACGYSITGGWELTLILILSFALLVALFVLVLVISTKDS